MTWTAVASAVALAIALAACSGLRAILPILLTGVAARAGWIAIGTQFHFLTTNRALLIFGLAALLEILGDKIPWVHHALDVLHTFLRPAAGSMLAAAALSSVSEPVTAIVVGTVVGAPTALVPHAVKSVVRVAGTALTGGLAAPALSVIEDVLAVLTFVLAVVLPVAVALFTLLTVAVLLWWMARRSRTAVRPASAY
jgi:hypothetical protein